MNGTWIERIEQYLAGTMTQQEEALFEIELDTNKELADIFSMYRAFENHNEDGFSFSSSVQDRRQEELLKRTLNSVNVNHSPLIKRIWLYVAAAAFLCFILIGSYRFMQRPSPEKMAGTYIKENLTSLGVHMGSSDSSIQSALQFYNDGNLQAALQQFEETLQKDSGNITATKYAGITALRLEMFDKAILYFRQLEGHGGLFSNPGKFYRALALMKRNQPGDIEEAKQLLRQVVQLKLEGNNTARQWLNQL